jgi:hypothetical protein
MKIFLSIFAVLALFTLLVTPIFASDVTNAEYLTKILVTNSSTAESNIIVTFTCNTSDMINGGMLSANASDAALRTSSAIDIPFMPGISGNPWVFYLPSIGAYSQLNEYLYSKNVTGGAIRYFPGSTGMSVPDTLTEPTNNFTLRISNTFLLTAAGENKTIFSHYDATNGGIKCFTSNTTSQNVTTRIAYNVATTNNMTPNAVGFYTNILSASPAVDHYLNVDDAPGAPDGDATWIQTPNMAQELDSYNLNTFTFLGYDQIITAVTVYFNGKYAGGAGGKAQPFLRLGGVDLMGTLVNLTNAYVSYSEALPRPGGGSWLISDFTDLQVGIGLSSNDGVSATRLTQIYVMVTYNYKGNVDVSATGVSDGEHDLSVGMASPFLGIGIDTTLTLPVTTNLTMNAPLWQTECSSSPFTTIDSDAYTATVTNAVWTLNQGYYFDGNDDKISLSDADFIFTNNFSVEGWVCLDSAFPAQHHAFCSIGEAANRIDVWARRNAAGNLLTLFNSTGGGAYVASNVSLSASWHHIVVAIRPSATINFYVDGVPAGSGAGLAYPAWAGALSIGNNFNLTADLMGNIGEFKIYNRALTAAEALQNYNATKSKYTSGSIYVYSTLNPIPDSSAPWQFGSDNTTLYIGPIEYDKGGVPVSAWEWEYDTIFHDSIGANDGTPSFRTTGSDSDVTAVISSQESLITSAPPSTAESLAWSMLTDAEKALLTVTPPGLYSEGGILFPGGQTIQDFADDTRYPVTFYLYPLAIGSSIALGLLVMAKTHNPSRGIRGSLMLQAGTSLLCMVLWVFGGGGVIAGWILIPFGLWCAVLLLWRNPYPAS